MPGTLRRARVSVTRARDQFAGALSTMAQISQDTFDQVVKENMDDFGMELEEAQKDA